MVLQYYDHYPKAKVSTLCNERTNEIRPTGSRPSRFQLLPRILVTFLSSERFLKALDRIALPLGLAHIRPSHSTSLCNGPDARVETGSIMRRLREAG